MRVFGTIGVGLAAAIVAACALPASPPEARVAVPLCDAMCARDERCGEAPLCECPRRARDTGAIRADWAAARIDCAKRAPCDADCDAVAYRAIGAGPLDLPPVVLRCLQKGDACGGSSVACKRLAATTDDARAEVDRCHALPCDEWRDCFASFLRARVLPAVPRWRE